MNMISQFEAAHMSELQYLEECFDRSFTYQDYVTNCEFLQRSPMSKRMFDGHMMRLNEQFYYETL